MPSNHELLIGSGSICGEEQREVVEGGNREVRVYSGMLSQARPGYPQRGKGLGRVRRPAGVRLCCSPVLIKSKCDLRPLVLIESANFSIDTSTKQNTAEIRHLGLCFRN